MTAQVFLDGKVTLHGGDCLDVLKTLPDCSIESCVTDPPYHLTSIVKRFGGANAAPAKFGTDGAFSRASRGFMNATWDGGDIAFRVELWAEVYRVLKPGGWVAAFSATRTYHRIACAIEDAGFEIRDQLAWCYGQGFPKSHNVSRNLDGQRCTCARPEASGEVLQHDMRPLRESDVSATERAGEECGQVLLESVQEQGPHRAVNGTGPKEISPAGAKSGMEGRRDSSSSKGELSVGAPRQVSAGSQIDGQEGRLRDGTSARRRKVRATSATEDGGGAPQGSPSAEQRNVEPRIMADEQRPQDGGVWPLCGGCGKPIVPDGLGTALKPAWEPICLGRKPLIGTVAENVLEHGTGALNIDATRVGSEGGTAKGRSADKSETDSVGGYLNAKAGAPIDAGRWPANIIHDGSDEVLAAFPDSQSSRSEVTSKPGAVNGAGAGLPSHTGIYGFDDSGSAARFFYSAKADKLDRIGSKHPTVKPVDLMQWLCRLITPPGGTVLDPFAGSGSTGEAAWREGFRCVLVEREAEYQADIAERLRLADKGPRERRQKAIRQVQDAGPLFGPANDNEPTGGGQTDIREVRGSAAGLPTDEQIGPVGLRR